VSVFFCLASCLWERHVHFADTKSGRYPAEWASPQLCGPTFDAATTAVPEMALGKRCRRTEDTHEDVGQGYDDGHQAHPCKKGRGNTAGNGVLEAAGTTSKACHKLATRTPTPKSDKSKTVGRGAGRLAATMTQEVYHQSLPGPSVQQALVGATAPPQLTWVEGSVGGSWHHHSSVVHEESEAHSTESDEHEEQAEG
jgi:hypothetical protein